MANNYLQFSVVVDVNPDKINELVALDDWRNLLRDQEVESIDEIKLPDFISDEDAMLFEFCQQYMVYEESGFETTFCPAVCPSEYYVYSEESGVVDLAVEWLYVLIRLELLKPKTGYVVFTWAETCSKPRPDEFTGGAAVISHYGVKFQQNAWEWANKQYKEMCYAA